MHNIHRIIKNVLITIIIMFFFVIFGIQIQINHKLSQISNSIDRACKVIEEHHQADMDDLAYKLKKHADTSFLDSEEISKNTSSLETQFDDPVVELKRFEEEKRKVIEEIRRLEQQMIEEIRRLEQHKVGGTAP